MKIPNKLWLEKKSILSTYLKNLNRSFNNAKPHSYK